jgi:hypothetical protein
MGKVTHNSDCPVHSIPLNVLKLDALHNTGNVAGLLPLNRSVITCQGNSMIKRIAECVRQGINNLIHSASHACAYTNVQGESFFGLANKTAILQKAVLYISFFLNT